MKTFVCQSIDELKVPAKEISVLLIEYPICHLNGEMGAGKTTLTSEICRCLNIDSPVSSPTFTIINEYSGPKNKIIHVDLYRINNQSELFNTGIEEYLFSGYPCLIEWPDIAAEIVPRPYLKVSIVALDRESREIVIEIVE